MNSVDHGKDSKVWGWRRVLMGLLCGLKYILQALLIVWAALAIYYSNLPSYWLRLVLALVFTVFSIWALWITRKRVFALIFGALFVIVLVWWLTIRPSHDRPWQPEVAVMPR